MKSFSKCNCGKQYGPHAANQPRDWLLSCHWKVLDCLSYGPSLVPSDFYLFGLFKKPFSGKTFATDANMKQAVTSWLRKLDTDLHYTKMQALLPRWDRRLNVNRDYLGDLVCTICYTCAMYTSTSE
jgi:hypothetical protein